MPNLKKEMQEVKKKEEKDKAKDRHSPMRQDKGEFDVDNLEPPNIEGMGVQTQDIEESMSHLVNSMGDKVEHPEYLTHLSKKETMVFSILESLTFQLKKTVMLSIPINKREEIEYKEDIEGVLAIDKFCERIYSLRISMNRKSRQELIKIAHSIGQLNQQEHMGWLQRIRNAF